MDGAGLLQHGATAAKDTCDVCGADSASRHFGGYCCNACKSFFRRCVRGKIEYRCVNGGDHSSELKDNRNGCRACRLRRCLSVGMDPRLVRPGYGDKLDGVSAGSVNSRSTASFDSTEPKESQQASVEPASHEITDLTGAESPNSLQLAPLSPSATQALSVAFNTMALGCFSGLLADYYRECRPSLATSKTGVSSLARYFIAVERFCDSFADTPLSHLGAECSAIGYDLNIALEELFAQPGSLIARTPVDWSPRFLIGGGEFMRAWCRCINYYADWASHVPELRLLDKEDVVKLLSERGTQCVFAIFSHHTITDGGGRYVCQSGGSYFPTSPVEQQLVDREILPLYQASINILADEIIPDGMEMHVTVGELALLKALCLCVPVQSLSPAAKLIISDAQLRYQQALEGEVMRVVTAASGAAPHHPAVSDTLITEAVMRRVGRLISWLATIERAANAANNRLSMMALFNIAAMGGSLPYEFHVGSSHHQ